MDVRFTNSKQSLSGANRPQVDWAQLTTADRIRWVEREGFVVIPDLLNSEQLDAIRSEVSNLPTTATDYSEHQRGSKGPWPSCPNAVKVIALPAMVEYLTALFGDELICTSCTYSVSEPGHPGIAIHTDSQPYGSKIFGNQSSSPVLVRVLYYLDDLTPERSPFKVIPYSHLSMHLDGVPYNRFLAHPDETMVTCRAGTAAVINQKVFHGNYPNYSKETRRLLAIAYRPAWAVPNGEVPARDAELIKQLPAEVRPLLGDPNTCRIDYDVPNRPDDLQVDAPGISPKRWE